MLSKKDFYKMVISMVVPIALQNLINVGVQAADVLMLGKVSETVLIIDEKSSGCVLKSYFTAISPKKFVAVSELK